MAIVTDKIKRVRVKPHNDPYLRSKGINSNDEFLVLNQGNSLKSGLRIFLIAPPIGSLIVLYDAEVTVAEFEKA